MIQHETNENNYVLLKFRTALFERRLMQISAQDLPLPLHPITLNKLIVPPPPLSLLTTQSWMSLCIAWQECKLQDVSNINVVGLGGGGVLPYMACMGGRGIVFLLSVLNRVYNFVQVCYRRIFADVIYCLHFSSLTYNLTLRSRGYVYELNAKLERAD